MENKALRRIHAICVECGQLIEEGKGSFFTLVRSFDNNTTLGVPLCARNTVTLMKKGKYLAWSKQIPKKFYAIYEGTQPILVVTEETVRQFAPTAFMLLAEPPKK